MTSALLLVAATASAWELGPPHDVERPVAVDRAIVGWSLDAGVVFPILDEVGPAGFVFVGSSAFEVRFPRREDARATANRLVALLDRPIAEVAPLGEGRPLAVELGDGGLVFGHGAWESLAGAVRPIEVRERGAPPVIGPDGFEEVLVVDDRRLTRATEVARRLLAERADRLARAWLDPADLVALDRWEAAGGSTPTGRWLGSVHTTTDWGLFANDRVQPRVAQRWLDWVWDPRGAFAAGAAGAVVAHGERATGWPLAVAPAEPEDPRVDLTGAGLTVRVQPDWTGQRVGIAAVADLRLEAVGGPASTVLLEIPHVRQGAWYTSPTQGEAWELVDARDEAGRALEVRLVRLRAPATDPLATVPVAIHLAEPLVPGAPRTVRVRWLDAARFAHVLETAAGESVSYGNATEPIAALPRAPGSLATPAVSLRATLATPFRRVRIVASGREVLRTVSEDERHHAVETVIDDGDAWIATGQWSERRSPGRPDLLFYTLNGWKDGQDRLVSRTRGAMSGRDAGPLVVVEGPSSPREARVADAGRGVIWHAQQLAGDLRTELRGVTLQHALEKQRWAPGRLPPASRQLQDALQLVAALERVRASERSDPTRATWVATRAALPSDGVVAADGQGDLPDAAVRWLGGRVLPAQVGEEAFRAALDHLRDGRHPSTWDGLEAALAEVTGEDAAGLLTTWRRSGVVPAIRVRWSWDGTTTRGTVISDLPFGTFVVPLRLQGDGDEVRERVRVTDGVGSFAVPWRGDAAPAVRVEDDALWLDGVDVRRDDPPPG